MIIKEDELRNYKKKLVMVDGFFDPLHAGHIEYFQEAAKSGLPVLCCMQSDETLQRVKHRVALLPEDQRAKVIDALASIQYVYICRASTLDTLKLLQPIKYIKGQDWKEKGLPPEQTEFCKQNGIEVVFLDTIRDSSTSVVDRFLSRTGKSGQAQQVDEFENFVLNQKEFDALHYDDQYFQGEWRAHHNSYSIEKRREIEAKNPLNIKETFRPKHILDFGCGPGALMLFLHELGVDVHGIDFSQSAKDEAPAEIKDRIVVGPVTEYHDYGLDFDLIICREVFEHLTVLQVQQAVKVMAQTAKKYIYVTTRFHPNPKSLLDVTIEPEVDPSHITLLNKNMLRVMFILEGLKTRPDLEQKLDWKNYDRVLVFEKV